MEVQSQAVDAEAVDAEAVDAEEGSRNKIPLSLCIIMYLGHCARGACYAPVPS